MSTATATPVRHGDRFFIGCSWVELAPDATVGVLARGLTRPVADGCA